MIFIAILKWLQRRPGPIKVYVTFATARLILMFSGLVYIIFPGNASTQRILSYCVDLGKISSRNYVTGRANITSGATDKLAQNNAVSHSIFKFSFYVLLADNKLRWSQINLITDWDIINVISMFVISLNVMSQCSVIALTTLIPQAGTLRNNRTYL